MKAEIIPQEILEEVAFLKAAKDDDKYPILLPSRSWGKTLVRRLIFETEDIDYEEIKQLSDKPKIQIMHFKEFQEDVQSWVNKCFGEEIAKDIVERNYRFFEEAIELVQASGMSKEQCLTLIDYVYNRPDGQVEKEVGGVIVTLSALCSARNIGLGVCAVVELDRIELMTDKIREKQKNKPKDVKNPLPGTLNETPKEGYSHIALGNTIFIPDPIKTSIDVDENGKQRGKVD